METQFLPGLGYPDDPIGQYAGTNTLILSDGANPTGPNPL